MDKLKKEISLQSILGMHVLPSLNCYCGTCSVNSIRMIPHGVNDKIQLTLPGLCSFQGVVLQGLKSLSWHHEGKQFLCSHADGSLATWNYKAPQKPVSVIMPHGKLQPFYYTLCCLMTLTFEIWNILPAHC